MNNCFVKNYNIERMKLEFPGKERPFHDLKQRPVANALFIIIGTFSPVTPANSNFIFP